jgi:hypothetical protein
LDVTPPLFVCDRLQSRKPLWNQPQVTPFAFSRSPTLRPVIVTVSRVSQTSPAGCGSPIIVPLAVSTPNAVARPGGTAPWVWPETRLIVPGLDGPKTVS